MLRQQHHIRAQFQKLLDAVLFAFSFFVAHWVRSHNPQLAAFGCTADITPFSEVAWLLLIIVPVAPFLLEMQGFYNRSIITTRLRTSWQLFRACTASVLAVILAMFLAKEELARWVVILFGLVSFVLILAKENLSWYYEEAKAGNSRFRKRLIVVGAAEYTAKLWTGHAGRAGKIPEGIEVVARLNLNETSVDQLIAEVHRHSANGVVISAKHTFFGQVEKAIQACELE